MDSLGHRRGGFLEENNLSKREQGLFVRLRYHGSYRAQRESSGRYSNKSPVGPGASYRILVRRGRVIYGLKPMLMSPPADESSYREYYGNPS